MGGIGGYWPPLDREDKPLGRDRALPPLNIVVGIVALWLLVGAGPVLRVLGGVLVAYEVAFHLLLVDLDRATRRARDACLANDRLAAAPAARACARSRRWCRLVPPLHWAYGTSIEWWWGRALVTAGDVDDGLPHLLATLPRSELVYWWGFRLVPNADLVLRQQLRRHEWEAALHTVEVGSRAVGWAGTEAPRVDAWRVVSRARISGWRDGVAGADAWLASVPAWLTDDPQIRAAMALARYEAAREHRDHAAAWASLERALAWGITDTQRQEVARGMLIVALRERRHDLLVRTVACVHEQVEAGVGIDGFRNTIENAVPILLLAGDVRTPHALLDQPAGPRRPPWFLPLVELETVARSDPHVPAIGQCPPAFVGPEDGPATALASAQPIEALTWMPIVRRLAGPRRVLVIVAAATASPPAAVGAAPASSDGLDLAWRFVRAEAFADLDDLPASRRDIDEWAAAAEREAADDLAAVDPTVDATLPAGIRIFDRLVHIRRLQAEVVALQGDREALATHRDWLERHAPPGRFYVSRSHAIYLDALMALHDGDAIEGRRLLDAADAAAADAGQADATRLESRTAWARRARALGHEAAALSVAVGLVPRLEAARYDAFARELASWTPSAAPPLADTHRPEPFSGDQSTP